MKRLVVIEDHHLVRTAVQMLLLQWFEPAEVDTAASMADAEHMLDRHRDVNAIVLDLDLPDSKGLDSIIRLQSLFPPVPIVVFSAYDSPPFVEQCLHAGAAAHVSKSCYPRELVDAVRRHLRADGTMAVQRAAAARGGQTAAITTTAAGPHSNPGGSTLIRLPSAPLTDRQTEVLHLLCKGLSTKEIALRMNLCSSTIKTHLTQIYKSLRVRNRLEALMVAQRILSNTAH